MQANRIALTFIFFNILKERMVKTQYCTVLTESSKDMISIDQLLHYFQENAIGRQTNSRREKYLFNSVLMSDRMIRTAFYLSKMTVPDEIRNGPLEFTHLKQVEFYEFIGRIAHIFFETTNCFR